MFNFIVEAAFIEQSSYHDLRPIPKKSQFTEFFF